MWSAFQPPEPFDTRSEPLPAPAAGIFDAPAVAVRINAEWLSHLDGLLERLLYADAWAGDDTDVERAIQEVRQLLLWRDNPMLLPGVMMPYAGDSPELPWLLCDGRAVSRVRFADLFAVCGTTYGAGDGSTTFTLPDLRGRAPIGAGQGPGLTDRPRASSMGAETHQLTIAQMPSHTHNFTLDAGGSGAFTVPATAANRAATSVSWPVASAGSGQAHNNMQPSLALHYVIYAGEVGPMIMGI